MPEFIGRPRLPEQLAAMRLQMAQRNPTADALNELSKSIQSALQTYSEHDMKAKLQNQLLGAKADQARAAAEAADERFQMGQRGATIRGMIGKGWTPTPGSFQIPMDERISGQFPLGQNEIQTQQFPSSRTMMQLTDLLQAQGIRPRAGDPGVAFNAPAPKPVKPSDPEIPPGPELDMIMKKARMPHVGGTPVNRHVFNYATDVVLAGLKGGGGAGGRALSPEEINANVDSLVEGGTTLSMLGGMGSQRAKINAAYEGRRKKNPGLMTLIELENTAKAQALRIRTLNSQQTTSELAGITQFKDAATEALRRIDAVGNSGFIPLNRLKQYTSQKILSTGKYAEDVGVLKAMTLEMAMQSSRVFSGTAATDIRVREELKRLDAAQTPAVFKQVVERLIQIVNTRQAAYLEAPTLLPGGRELQTRPAPGTEPATAAPSNLDAIGSLLKKHLLPGGGQ